MHPIDLNAPMTEDEKKEFERKIAIRFVTRMAAIVFFKVFARRTLIMIANRSYQSSATEH